MSVRDRLSASGSAAVAERKAAAPTQGDLVYSVGQWPRMLWSQHREATPAVSDIERRGAERASRYADWMRESFARLYRPSTPMVQEPAKGTEWAQRLHQEADAVPEFARLAERTAGDEVTAAIGAMAIADRMVAAMQPRKPHRDVEACKRRVEQMREMIAKGMRPVGPLLKNAEAELADAEAEAEEAAQGIDPTAIRQAARAGAADAQEQIDAFESSVQAFSYGSEPGTPVRLPAERRRALAARVQHNDKLREIAEQAGRLRRIAATKQREKADHARDEACDVARGADVDRLLPSEMAALASDDEDTEAMALSRWAERSMLQYDLRGTERLGRGPILCLLDVSGSMSSLDSWAKAVALALLEVARRQRRPWGVVFFDSEVQRVDYVDGKASRTEGEAPREWRSLEEHMVDMAGFFTAGGTNFSAPLARAASIIAGREEALGGKMRRADIVIITDGVAPVDDAVRATVEDLRVRGKAAVYTVFAGPTCQDLAAISDRTWEAADLVEDDDDFADEVFSI